MKKILSFVLLGLAVVLASCERPVTPPVPPPADEPALFSVEFIDASGTRFTLNDGDSVSVVVAKINEMTDQMTFDGEIIKMSEGKFELFVDVTRTTLDGSMDELCLSQCVPGNGQATQCFSDIIANDITPFYAHLTPEDFTTYVIDYWFHEHGATIPGIHITVIYDVEAAFDE